MIKAEQYWTECDQCNNLFLSQSIIARTFGETQSAMPANWSVFIMNLVEI